MDQYGSAAEERPEYCSLAGAHLRFTEEQQKAFLNVLKEATTRLSKPSEATLLRDILKQEYQLPPALVDTLELQRVKQATTVRESDITAAQDWLKRKYDNKKRRQ